MANPLWPATLPPLTELASFNEQPPDLLLRTPNASGPPKIRRRATANIRPLAGTLLMTKAQLDIFDAFFVTDLLGGAIPFDGTHPRTGAAMSANLKRPGYRHASGPYWEVAIELEVLP